ncbi:MAG TPA: hypothetical protein VHE30_24595 [Polyangiaceae bacterium]|nr:hypothetical protein [Polyangiaceae bacterium]
MNSTVTNSKVHHPLFRAMVVMGSSLATGCGGVAETKAAGGTGAGGAPPDGDSGGFGQTGGTVGAGGTFLHPGGFVGSGGALSTGGAADEDAGPFPCVPAQWDCTGVDLRCGGTGRGYTLPACKCDPSRPRTEADCRLGDRLVCLDGLTDPSGVPLPASVPFQCSCVRKTDSCQADCVAASPLRERSLHCDEDGPDRLLCGCAWVTLR